MNKVKDISKYNKEENKKKLDDIISGKDNSGDAQMIRAALKAGVMTKDMILKMAENAQKKEIEKQKKVKK